MHTRSVGLVQTVPDATYGPHLHRADAIPRSWSRYAFDSFTCCVGGSRRLIAYALRRTLAFGTTPLRRPLRIPTLARRSVGGPAPALHVRRASRAAPERATSFPARQQTEFAQKRVARRRPNYVPDSRSLETSSLFTGRGEFAPALRASSRRFMTIHASMMSRASLVSTAP